MNAEYTNAQSVAVICFCNSNPAWGGGEKWYLETSLRLAGRGYRVILACPAQGPLWQATQEALLAERDKDPGLGERFTLADWRFGNLSFLNPFKKTAFSRFLSENGVTHIIMNLPADLKFVASAGTGKNFSQGTIKLFYRRGSAIPVKANALNRKLFGRLTCLIANSLETAECVRQADILDPCRIRVIYNGLDVAGFDTDFRAGVPDGAAAPSGDFCAARPLIIGNAGRLSRQKAQKYLLYMSAELRRRKFPHKLIIAGEGELRQELETLAARLGLCCVYGPGGFMPDNFCRAEDWHDFYKQPGDVFFTGFLKDLSPFWRCIDMFVLSSVWEGFGYALAEAMLAKKPLLAFDMNSMPELVRSGVNGILLPPPDQDESDASVGVRLARQAIAFSRSQADMSRMGRAGRDFCLENFDQRVSLARLEELLFAELNPVETAEAGAAPELLPSVEPVVEEVQAPAAEDDEPDIPDLAPAAARSEELPHGEAVMHPLLQAGLDESADNATEAGRWQEVVINVRKKSASDARRKSGKPARGADG